MLLARPGRVLAPNGAPKWPAFVLDTCLVLGGDLDAAVEAAAAVDLIAAAADVVDDLVDDDWNGPPRDAHRALNATLALTSLAQMRAFGLADRLGSERAARIAAILSGSLTAAAAGEDLDIRLEDDPTTTEEIALDMTSRKSGELISMAFQVGAAIATDDRGVIEQCGAFGRRVGIVAQVVNDIAGIAILESARGSDLARRKKTLPVAYALRCAEAEGVSPILAWYGLADGHATESAVAAAIQELGGHHYAWVVADAHRREALRILSRLTRATGRRDIQHLRRLLPDLTGGVVRAKADA